jgi:hypothetical protein
LVTLVTTVWCRGARMVTQLRDQNIKDPDGKSIPDNYSL